MAESRILQPEVMFEWLAAYQETEGRTLYSSTRDERQGILDRVKAEINQLTTPESEIEFITTLGKMQRESMAKKHTHLAAFISGLRTYCISQLRETNLYRMHLERKKWLYHEKFWKTQEEIEEALLFQDKMLSPDEFYEIVKERDEHILAVADLGDEQFIVRAKNSGLLSAWLCSSNSYIPDAYSKRYHEDIYNLYIQHTRLSTTLKEKDFSQFVNNSISQLNQRSIRSRGRTQLKLPELQRQPTKEVKISKTADEKTNISEVKKLDALTETKALHSYSTPEPRIRHQGIKPSVLKEWLDCYLETTDEAKKKSPKEQVSIIYVKENIASLNTPETQIDFVVNLGRHQRQLQDEQRQKDKKDSPLAMVLSAMRIYCINELASEKTKIHSNDAGDTSVVEVSFMSSLRLQIEEEFYKKYFMAQEKLERLQLDTPDAKDEINDAMQERDELILTLADLGNYRFIVRASNFGLFKNWPHPTAAEAKASPDQYNEHIPYAYSPSFDRDMYTKVVMPGQVSQTLREHEFKQARSNTNGLFTSAGVGTHEKPMDGAGDLLERELELEDKHISSYDVFITNSIKGRRDKTRKILPTLFQKGGRETPRAAGAGQVQTQFSVAQ